MRRRAARLLVAAVRVAAPRRRAPDLGAPPPPAARRRRGGLGGRRASPLREDHGEIRLDHVDRPLQFGRLPATGGGAFTALTRLRISIASVDSRDLDDVLSSRCPSLKELVLHWIALQDGAHVFPVRSNSLQHLEISTSAEFKGLLRIVTPELRKLNQWFILCDAYIAAPKISEVQWFSRFYHPSRHHFAEAGRHLRRLEVATKSSSVELMRRFDTVHELNLNLYISKGVQQYQSLLENDLKELATCEVLVVKCRVIEHYLMPVMVHLLQKCAGIRKLVVQLSYIEDRVHPCKSSECPCNSLENCKIDHIVLDSLEEVEVLGGGELNQKVELVRLLSKCSATSKKSVLITVYQVQTHYKRMKLRSIIPPNNRVKIFIRPP